MVGVGGARDVHTRQMPRSAEAPAIRFDAQLLQIANVWAREGERVHLQRAEDSHVGESRGIGKGVESTERRGNTCMVGP